ncbi:ABC transporter permease [Fundicoccus culcitae]|uniref:ABC transporter permease n=1 Tax=Fundicoccus culcitae TaxID=2969821 RepID=A0ABY5P383_9LACT|nr:ABC transporter permease [Fundicoccus culcitae]UUX32960.1 ABC transporter permease [Fundicoccus culcitae]
MLDIIISSLAQGCVWAIMAIGVYITYRLLNIADMSAEAVFPLGAAVSAIMITNDVNPLIATVASFFAGSLAGMVAGLIHTKMKIPPLLTGILVLTGLYTINMHVMGRPNIALIGSNTIFKGLTDYLNLGRNIPVIIVSLIIVAIIVVVLNAFLHTEIGLALRSTGDNEQMSQANGINTDNMKTLAYMIGNGLIALSGSLIAQKDGFADIGMGTGTMVIGMSSLIIAEVVIPNQPLGIRLSSLVVGSFIYRIIIDLILNQRFFKVEPYDIKLFSAILLGFVLYLPEMKKHLNKYRRNGQLSGGK